MASNTALDGAKLNEFLQFITFSDPRTEIIERSCSSLILELSLVEISSDPEAKDEVKLTAHICSCETIPSYTGFCAVRFLM